ncbi:MAG TPA: hypothetical protein VII23_11280 [Terriglobales bacterium]
MPSYHFERALFVVGEPNSGKSNQLRSMFRDVRLGTAGIIPRDNKIPDFYRLSNDRCLYLRLTSPHEMGETIRRKQHGQDAPTNFLQKTADKIIANTSRLGRRWNFASALQPNAAKNMPNVVEVCSAFVRYFNPERVRVVFLSPDWHGESLQQEYSSLVPGLRKFPSVEVCWIDAGSRTANGLLLADFFDFT